MVVFVVVSIILFLVNHPIQMDRKRKNIPKVDVVNPSQSAILPG